MIHRMLLLVPLLFLGCAQHVDDQAALGSFIRGNARVISIDPAMGQAVLDYNGRHINAYWQTESFAAQGGSISQNDPLKPPVAQYNESVSRSQTINAVAGDSVAFVGMKTASGILLRGVAVVNRKP